MDVVGVKAPKRGRGPVVVHLVPAYGCFGHVTCIKSVWANYFVYIIVRALCNSNYFFGLSWNQGTINVVRSALQTLASFSYLSHRCVR